MDTFSFTKTKIKQYLKKYMTLKTTININLNSNSRPV